MKLDGRLKMKVTGRACNDRMIFATKQQGAVLVVGLIMLLVMTIIGLSAMRSTILEEKMAGNFRDSNIAFQAAEAALRDGENDVMCQGCTRSPVISGLTNFDSSCTGGLCGGWSPTVWTDATKMGNAVVYGTYTAATAISGVAAPPKYLVEGKKCNAAGWATWKNCYQITATGYGGSTTTTRILQEVYITP
ncbi:MAG TPA: hypothetical protein ENJ08_11970 [Gammaproteobacteria bacterium]|nr:hypothetical protein [Gammaproteobacteria bacterium]